MVGLFNYKKEENFFMKCLLIGVCHFHLSSKSYQNTEIQFCSNIIVLLICTCMPGQHRFSKNWNLFQNKLHISKLLTIIFIRMFDMQYWNSIDVCNTWKIEEKLKILVWFNIVDLLHFSSKFPDPPKIRNMKIPVQYENFPTLPQHIFF